MKRVSLILLIILLEFGLSVILYSIRRWSYTFQNDNLFEQFKVGVVHGIQYFLFKIPLIVLVIVFYFMIKRNYLHWKYSLYYGLLSLIYFFLIFSYVDIGVTHSYLFPTGVLISILIALFIGLFAGRRRITNPKIIDEGIKRTNKADHKVQK